MSDQLELNLMKFSQDGGAVCMGWELDYSLIKNNTVMYLICILKRGSNVKFSLWCDVHVLTFSDGALMKE